MESIQRCLPPPWRARGHITRSAWASWTKMWRHGQSICRRKCAMKKRRWWSWTTRSRGGARGWTRQSIRMKWLGRSLEMCWGRSWWLTWKIKSLRRRNRKATLSTITRLQDLKKRFSKVKRSYKIWSKSERTSTLTSRHRNGFRMLSRMRVAAKSSLLKLSEFTACLL